MSFMYFGTSRGSLFSQVVEIIFYFTGFGLRNDLKFIESALPQIGGTLSCETGHYIDLHHLWHRLTIDYQFTFPFSGMYG